MTTGPSIKDVRKILPLFTPPPSPAYFGLVLPKIISSVRIWQIPLWCGRPLWMTPRYVTIDYITRGLVVVATIRPRGKNANTHIFSNSIQFNIPRAYLWFLLTLPKKAKCYCKQKWCVTGKIIIDLLINSARVTLTAEKWYLIKVLVKISNLMGASIYNMMHMMFPQNWNKVPQNVRMYIKPF